MKYRHLWVVCLLVMAGCAEGTATTSTTGGDTSTTSAPTTTRAETPTTQATPTTAAGPRRFTASGFAAPFSIDHPEGWSILSSQESVEVAVVNKWGLFWADDRDSEQWLEYLSGHEYLIATDPVEAEVGGSPAISFQVTGSDDIPQDLLCGEPCVWVVGEWVSLPGMTMQVWLVDIDGQTVFITADAERADQFEGWIAEFSDVLETLVWE